MKNLQNTVGVFTLLGFGIVIGAFLVYLLIFSGAKPKAIGVGPIEFDIPTSQPQTPGVMAALPTTEPQGPSLEPLGTIRVFGNSNQGVQVQAPKSGIYRFVYSGGAYSTYAINSAPAGEKTWLTAILVFLGDRALWDGNRIKDEDIALRLADTKYWSTQEEAESSAQGQYVETQLNEGDKLTFIGVDGQSYYADNPGQVLVEWFFVNY